MMRQYTVWNRMLASPKAVALAVGLTWYLQEEPKHNPPAYLQVVQAADHQVYCGE
jgi:hypothetical protein